MLPTESAAQSHYWLEAPVVVHKFQMSDRYFVFRVTSPNTWQEAREKDKGIVCTYRPATLNREILQ